MRDEGLMEEGVREEWLFLGRGWKDGALTLRGEGGDMGGVINLQHQSQNAKHAQLYWMLPGQKLGPKATISSSSLIVTRAHAVP